MLLIPLFKKAGTELGETFGMYEGGQNAVLMGKEAYLMNAKSGSKEAKTETRKETRKQPYTSNTFVLDLYVSPAFNEYQALQPLRYMVAYCSLKR